MEPLSLCEVARLAGAHSMVGNRTGDVTGISTDTRTLRCGDLFIALRGERFDGHRFISVAVRKGAGGLIIEDGYPIPPGAPALRVTDSRRALARLATAYRHRFAVRTVAITGSVAKTTTKNLTQLILSGSYKTVASPRSFNNENGVPLTLLELGGGTEVAVLELGASAPGEIDYLAGLVRPEVGVLTAIRRAHLCGFGNFENVRKTKGELLFHLKDGVVVANGEDPAVEKLLEDFSGRIVRFGSRRGCNIRVQRVREGDRNLIFSLCVHGKRVDGRIALAGRHQMLAVCAAVGVAVEMGIDPEEAIERLDEYRPSGGRMTPVQGGSLLIYDDSYNANPSSVRAAVAFLARRTPSGEGRRICVLGDMKELGPKSEALHRQVGREIASRGIDHLIAVGPHAGILGSEARRLSAGRIRVWRARNAQEAASAACWLAVPGDRVLVKGSRAMGLEKVVQALEENFSDGGTRAAIGNA